MSNGRGGYRPNSGRPLNTLNEKSLQIIRAIRDVVAENAGKYERAIVMLLDDALDENTKARDRLAIVNFFVERLEGKATQYITLQPQEKTTIKDLLRGLDSEQSNGSQ